MFGLLTYYLLEARGERGPIIKSLTTTRMVIRLGELYNVPVYETQVGFKYLGPKMIETNGLIGGEESGGYAFRGHLPERDGVLAALCMLDFMVRTGKRPSELLAELYERVGPHHYDRVDIRMPAAEKDVVQTRVAAARPESVAGVKVTDQDDAGRLSLQPGERRLAAAALLGHGAAAAHLHGGAGQGAGAAAAEGGSRAGRAAGGQEIGAGCTCLTTRRRTRGSTRTACGGRIGGLPEQCREAWQQAKAFAFPPTSRDVDTVLVLGMGGSAIAGDIVRALALRHSRKTGHRAPRVRPAAVVGRADAGRRVQLQRRDGGDAVVVRQGARRAVEEDGHHDGRQAAGARAQSRGLPAYVVRSTRASRARRWGTA